MSHAATIDFRQARSRVEFLQSVGSPFALTWEQVPCVNERPVLDLLLVDFGQRRQWRADLVQVFALL